MITTWPTAARVTEREMLVLEFTALQPSQLLPDARGQAVQANQRGLGRVLI